MSEVEKVERNGKVAVIVSPGYGAGWATWSDHYEAALFAPDVVKWIEEGKPDDDDRVEAFGEKYGYTGGLSQAEVEWVDRGQRIRIDEYDGSEALEILDPDVGWIVV